MKNKHVLIDTSIIIDHLRQKQKNTTVFFKLVKKKYYLHCSIISHTELYAGKSVWEKPQALTELEILFQSVTVIPLTLSISAQAGKLRALYSLTTIDAIIAATALEEKLPLVTINTKDFVRVKNLKQIKV